MPDVKVPMLIVLSLAVAGATVGCATSTEASRNRAASQADSFHRRLQLMPDVIDAAIADLMAATSGQNPNRDADIREFQRSLRHLNDEADYLGGKYQAALNDSNQFYRNWQRDARKLSGAERIALEEEIGQRLATRQDAIDYLERGRTSFIKLGDTLSNIEANLLRDGSERNALAQGPAVQRAVVDAYDTRIYIDRLDEVLSAAIDLN